MGKGAKRDTGKTKNQRKEQLERKRDERSQRNSLKKGKKSNGNSNADTFKSFCNQLDTQGLQLRDVIGDGNCLFRALADQLDGDQNMHGKHRKDAVSYMRAHENDFIPFIEESITFEKYLKNLASQGTYGGNDSIVAFARHTNTDIIIHQLSNPTFIVEGCENEKKRKVLHLAYHDFEHYSSVRRKTDPGSGPAYPYHNIKDTVATWDTSCTEYSTPVCDDVIKSESKIKDVINGENYSDNPCSVKDADHSEPYIVAAIEQIKHDSGCYDTEYIRNTFIDNSFDTDATLSCLLQTMSLNGKSVELSSSDDSSRINNHDSATLMKDSEMIAENNILEDSSNEKDDKSSTNCACSQNEEERENDFSPENEIKKKDKKGKENKTKPNIKKPTNRQRKEIAKQARKKRRQESRQDSHSSDTTTEDIKKTTVLSNGSIQSINI